MAARQNITDSEPRVLFNFVAAATLSAIVGRDEELAAVGVGARTARGVRPFRCPTYGSEPG